MTEEKHREPVTPQEFEPCGHPGCLNHVSHPCEGCGRVAGRFVTPARESVGIYESQSVVIPLADVNYIVKRNLGIQVVMHGTTYDIKSDDYNNSAWIHEKEQQDFIDAWYAYRNSAEQLAQVQRERDELLILLTELREYVDTPPDRSCSCHISPPCNDCVDNSHLRDVLDRIAFLERKKP